jgi:flagellar hook assembly protein FlgD
MYEIDGEHGKSNGQFGYRTTITSKWPGDGVSTPDIDLTHTIVYPGSQQIPIQVDVTNVHSVRSTSSLVGAKVAVGAQPYNISYRFSKDALTRIQIIDPTLDSTATPMRTLINWEPRLGEGTPGGPEKYDTVTTEVEAWDGRDSRGRLLPYGNYNVAIQALSQDEWTGSGAPLNGGQPVAAMVDLSRTVTRQLSLDPLKITDLTATGLNKTSTGYAMLAYMLTESATVHVQIYTPGTKFSSNMGMVEGGYANVTVSPTVQSGTGFLVAEYTEQKQGRAAVNTKWDGRCWYDSATDGCQKNGYNLGALMGDGDYIYLIWAEIPYGGADTVAVNGVTWNGVKTRMIHNGILPVNRGLPDILIQPAGYSSVGSSPTAFGLDPFIFRFSVSRDSIVSAAVKTSSAVVPGGSGNQQTYTVKTLLDNQVKVANQMNVETWDGKDDNGRYVGPGSYILEVVAKDALFPTKQVTSSVIFPVDLFRVVDVTSTPIIGEATSQSTINYMLSKSMDVTLDIYDKNVIVPSPGANAQWPPLVCGAPGAPATVQDNCIHWAYDAVGTTPTTPLPAPLKRFTGARPGEGVMITEFWDGFDENSAFATSVKDDGMYPYIIYAKAQVPSASYYKVASDNNPYPVDGKLTVNQADSMNASDKPVGYITIARGPVYFTAISIKPSQPQLFYSSETVQIPAYEVSFAVTRTAEVTIEIRSSTAGACMGPTSLPGTICRVLTKTKSSSLSTVYDAIATNKLYWDGKDDKGEYVKRDGYEVRFTAKPYPGTGTQTPTVKTVVLNVNNFQVFDRFIWDVSPTTKGIGKFAYQVSVPMKVAIQIFKPGTRIADPSTGTLVDPVDPLGPEVGELNVSDVLVKAIVGVSPHLVALEYPWDGTDYAGQKVPDGVYPFRFVTVLDSYDMDSVDGHINAACYPPSPCPPGTITVQDKVADWDKFINLGVINVANGDSWYADLDWKDDKVTMFFPNPLRKSEGQFEITKVPAPGTVTIKIYNIAGDLVRGGGYNCINARGVTATLDQINNSGGLEPDWNITGGTQGTIVGGRNFALRCAWDKTNDHGKQVARGLYYAIMELNPTRGNAKKSQKVIKILIP